MGVCLPTNSIFQLLVTATDQGDNQLDANTTVTVRVKDVNDNAPIFTIPTKNNATLYATTKSEKPIVLIRVSKLQLPISENVAAV